MAQLHVRSGKLVIAGGEYIFSFDYEIKSGQPSLKRSKKFKLNSSSDQITDSGEKKSINDIDKKFYNTGTQCQVSALSGDGRLFAIATTSKCCLIYDAFNDWCLHRSSIQLPKAPTAIIFDNTEKYVIVSDRAGNVYRYPVNSSCEDDFVDSDNIRQNLKKRNGQGDEKVYEGEFLLGHLSMILDIALSADGRYLLSVDRDEKVRISRYPQTFVIHRFCFGHTSYVSSVVTYNNEAFTAGGDGCLRVWNLENGAELAVFNHLDGKAVRYLKMSAFADKLLVIFEQSNVINIALYNRNRNDFEVSSLNCPDKIIDAVFSETAEHIFLMTRSFLASVEVHNNHLTVINDMEEILESIKNVEVELPFLEKKVQFNNLDQYHQRKEARIKQKRKKLSA